MKPPVPLVMLEREVACPCCHGTGRLPVRSLLTRAVARSVVTEAGCWEYPSAQPYPVLMDRVLRLPLHQLAYRLWHGVPAGMVLHTCDNVRCWRPDHLYDGNAQQNNTDRRTRARTYGRAGAANHFAKLTAEQVAELREGYAREGVLRRRVAMDYARRWGVHMSTVYAAARGRSWREDTRVRPEPLPLWHQRGVQLRPRA